MSWPRFPFAMDRTAGRLEIHGGENQNARHRFPYSPCNRVRRTPPFPRAAGGGSSANISVPVEAAWELARKATPAFPGGDAPPGGRADRMPAAWLPDPFPQTPTAAVRMRRRRIRMSSHPPKTSAPSIRNAGAGAFGLRSTSGYPNGTGGYWRTGAGGRYARQDPAKRPDRPFPPATSGGGSARRRGCGRSRPGMRPVVFPRASPPVQIAAAAGSTRSFFFRAIGSNAASTSRIRMPGTSQAGSAPRLAIDRPRRSNRWECSSKSEWRNAWNAAGSSINPASSYAWSRKRARLMAGTSSTLCRRRLSASASLPQTMQRPFPPG